MKKKVKIQKKISKNEVINVYLSAQQEATVYDEDERYGRAIENLIDNNLYNF